jgi:hypothetical protein
VQRNKSVVISIGRQDWDKGRSLGLDFLRLLLYLQEAQGFSRTQSKSRLVYCYSKHSSQGSGNDGVSSAKTGSITAPGSSNKVESKLAKIEENVRVTQLGSGMLVTQVRSEAKSTL